jgi:ssDNA-binding Zn-finger/Zn-ribbon topoisomerase 1
VRTGTRQSGTVRRHFSCPDHSNHEPAQPAALAFAQSASDDGAVFAWASRAMNACPKCGASLVLRTVRKGANAGGSFFGCSGFPKCRYTRLDWQNFEIPKTWGPTLFWPVNQLGAGQRVERVSAEKGTRGGFLRSNRGQREGKRESPGFYRIVASPCGCWALEKYHRCGGTFTKFSPISRL